MLPLVLLLHALLLASCELQDCGFQNMAGERPAGFLAGGVICPTGRWEVRGEEDDVVLAAEKPHIGINRKCARYSE